jgi:hypothetical protein
MPEQSFSTQHQVFYSIWDVKKQHMLVYASS